MTRKVTLLAGAAALLALAGCVEDTGAPAATGMPAVGSSTDLTPFIGARAGQAEMGITSLGYELIRSQGLTSYWFNRSTGACAAVTTSDGRYSNIVMLAPDEC